MAIRSKNKRRVSVDNKEYLWWVFDEYDQTEFDGIQIKAICSDQTHFIKYGLQQEPDDRKLVLAWENYTKLVHLSSPPVFEDNEGIISMAGIKEMIQLSKKERHRIQYSCNGNKNDLTEPEQQLLLKEIQEKLG
ncbi:hypothetical protein MKJ01_16575 [Chryseobacterium sp. SSA4.19]|uniref:hypothetical protein n=1 Tax=Chryseobacterium sp. SSA4.19 TaxID=2919915 RepID=UPI001F4E48C1|nr:hypothetical protein [Chryseobacterium sp. SSA4.19]MCJ8155382.1 hypothetical protein [Chryseobacterium sp. SSA4.19]